jgi:two-component system sensor histidine kinase UhpB
MSLQLKLNLMITCLLLALLTVSTFFVVKNSREDVRAEISSTSNLVLHLLDDEMLHYLSDYDWMNTRNGTSIFRLQSLDNMRHLKIDFYDINGRLRETNRKTKSSADACAAPAWFVTVMGTAKISTQKKAKKIILNGRFVGTLVITPDPSYEIAEVWKDTISILGLVAIFFVMINILVYWAVQYTFKAINRIIDALTKMQQGNFNSRLPNFSQTELHEMGQKFNAMADTLKESTQNNRRLTQQIIRLQEDERQSLARDIHDEIGQYLTAIHVDACAILNGRKLSSAKESALAISMVTRQMMDVVHQIIQRLRPRVLDELGLGLALIELVHHWRQRCRNTMIVCHIDKNLGILDELVSITAYRVVQECLTNIAKHANAGYVSVKVKQDEQFIHLYIEDDGVGFSQTVSTQGFGLAGMIERVQGLLGEINIQSSINQGVKVTVKLRKKVLEVAIL